MSVAPQGTVWALKRQCANFIYCLGISADAAQEKEKKEKKVLLTASVSKFVAHTVMILCRFLGIAISLVVRVCNCNLIVQ